MKFGIKSKDLKRGKRLHALETPCFLGNLHKSSTGSYLTSLCEQLNAILQLTINFNYDN